MMQRKSELALNSVKVSSSIAVLLPAEGEEWDGTSYSKDGDWVRGRRIRVMREKDLRSKQRLMQIAKDNPGWIDLLTGVKLLQSLSEEGDDPIVRHEAYRLLAPTWGFDVQKPAREDLSRTYLPHSLGYALADVRLTFWRSRPDKKGNQRLRPGLFCADLKTAAAVRWLLSPDLRVCTHCGKIFLAERKKHRACSIACRERHRVARFWARKKEQAA